MTAPSWSFANLLLICCLVVSAITLSPQNSHSKCRAVSYEASNGWNDWVQTSTSASSTSKYLPSKSTSTSTKSASSYTTTSATLLSSTSSISSQVTSSASSTTTSQHTTSPTSTTTGLTPPPLPTGQTTTTLTSSTATTSAGSASTSPSPGATATLSCASGVKAFHVVLNVAQAAIPQFAGTTYESDNSYGAIYNTDGDINQQPPGVFGLSGTDLITCNNGQAYTVQSDTSTHDDPVLLAPPSGLTGYADIAVTISTGDVIGSVLNFRTSNGDTTTDVCGSAAYFQVGNSNGQSSAGTCKTVVVTTEYITQ